MDLRSATPDDAAAMAAVHIDAWRTAYRGLVPDSFLAALDHKRSTERFHEFLESGEGETYIVERDGRAIGHLTVGSCRDDDLSERTVGEIWGIYLAPVHWRQGIGTRVCRQAESMLRARGFRRSVLWVFEGNERARRFYEAMGYAPDGATKSIEVGAPRTAVRYRKDLAAGPRRPKRSTRRSIRCEEGTACLCDLYCGDCAGHSGRPADAAQNLRDAMEAYRFARTAECVFASEIPDDAQFRETLAAIGARPRAAREEGTTSCAVRACCTQGGQFACHEHDGFKTCATLRRNVERYGDASLRNIRAVGLDAWLTAGDRRWSRRLCSLPPSRSRPDRSR
jgi:RimJ/RimL family protein N-acetyltransferase